MNPVAEQLGELGLPAPLAELAGRDWDVVIVERPLEGAGAAEALPPLEHQDALPRPREVGSGGQAVVAPADHNRVPVSGGERVDGHREPDLAETCGDLVQAETASRSRSASM